MSNCWITRGSQFLLGWRHPENCDACLKSPKICCLHLDFWSMVHTHICLQNLSLVSIPRWVSCETIGLFLHPNFWVSSSCFYEPYPMVEAKLLWCNIGPWEMNISYVYVCGTFCPKTASLSSRTCRKIIHVTGSAKTLQTPMLRTDVSSFHAHWWLHGIWSCPPPRCWITPLTFPWVIWLGAGNPSKPETMANGHWKQMERTGNHQYVSTCQSFPLSCFHCYT